MRKVFLLISLFCYTVNKSSNNLLENKSLAAAAELNLKVKVIGIKDGDTVEVLYYKLPLTIRLEHIDAPEKKQAFGNVSKEKLAGLCFGKNIIIKSKKAKGTYDRNGRMIAELYYENGRSINIEMVKAGLAWHYKQYSTDQTYANAELLARNNKVGLWKEKSPIAPWLYRK